MWSASMAARASRRAVRRGAGGSRRWRDARRLRSATARSSTRPSVRSRRSGGSYHAGARVFHQKFGYGQVVAVDGDKLDIEFDKAGPKKVMASFVVPAEQAR